MGFLYPLFLAAGAALAIPVLIHLFNLRRYKTVLFPHTRFLRNIDLQSRRQSKLRYKLLLAFRLLFLAALVLAFAQPFFGSKSAVDGDKRLQIIYIDNSYSLTIKNGARTLLETARDAAALRVRNAAPDAQFIIISGDAPISYKPLRRDEALKVIQSIEAAPLSPNNSQIFGLVQSMMQTEGADAADLFYYSDFQRNAFNAQLPESQVKNIRLHAIMVQGTAAAQNAYVDTAFLTSPVLEAGIPAKLVVRSRITGSSPDAAPVLQLSVNGQVKSASTPSFNKEGSSYDTLEFTAEGRGWQRIQITLSDGTVPFDDTFRISARSAPNLAVLVLNEGQQSPYINAAFRAYSGFTVAHHSPSSAPADWRPYNLVVYNGITSLSAADGQRISSALKQGQSVCIFPGRTSNFSAFNPGMDAAAGIRITGLDTAAQSASTLQSGSDLVKDIFERIPQNVELPFANWHYTVEAALQSNAQSVISFRDGDPLLSQYAPEGRGQLFLSTVSADAGNSNFAASYFFVPFLYQMALQSGGTGVYALTSGRRQAAYLPLRTVNDRQMLHLRGPGIDAIPPQRAAGGGVDVFVDAAVQQPGFYQLSDGSSPDSAVIALNADRVESLLELWPAADLQKKWTGKNAEWLSPEEAKAINATNTITSFPWWRILVALALLWLLAECIYLAQPAWKSVKKEG